MELKKIKTLKIKSQLKAMSSEDLKTLWNKYSNEESLIHDMDDFNKAMADRKPLDIVSNLDEDFSVSDNYFTKDVMESFDDVFSFLDEYDLIDFLISHIKESPAEFNKFNLKF